jgi:1,4-dihydroxy-2-naphthoate octaprenyltransferase
VRLGTEKGVKVVQAAVVTLYSLIIGLSLCKVLPLSCTLFSVLTLPIGILVMRFISENHKVQFCSLLTGGFFFLIIC